MYIYAASGTYGATVAMTELSNLGAATHRLKFKLRANFSVGGVVQVGYMTDRTDPASFVMLQSFTTTSTSVYQECTVDPGNLPGASTTLAFRMPATPGYSALIDDVEWSVIPTATLSWYNLQWPVSATILANQNESIYAQCWEPGVTEAAGPGTGIECWIGYSATNSNPNTWTNWVLASYNFGSDPSNNDEYMASLGAAQGLIPGTYYYASRFRYLSGPFTYGGYNGGPWNGTGNVSGVLTVNPVPPATLPFTEGFESGQSNWISVNGTQTNQWYVGTATANNGTQSLYVSNDGGVNNAYTITSSSTVHFYRDITFPAGTNPFNLKFSWKGVGETTLYDYLQVHIVPTTTVPVAGTLLGAIGQVGVNYYDQATWQNVDIDLDNATYAGQTWRVVFTWKNDGSLGTQPPAAVDDVIVTELAPATKTLNLTNVRLEHLFVTGTGGLMNQAYNAIGPEYTAPTADVITVELHDAVTYATILRTYPGVLLSQSGTASVSGIDLPDGNYRITIKHRNSIETTSTVVNFTGATVAYSFGTAASAFGNNLKLIDGFYCIFGGDVNQDGQVEGLDITPIDVGVATFVKGYVVIDVDGDGQLTTGDFTIWENNNNAFVVRKIPTP